MAGLQLKSCPKLYHSLSVFQDPRKSGFARAEETRFDKLLDRRRELLGMLDGQGGRWLNLKAASATIEEREEDASLDQRDLERGH